MFAAAGQCTPRCEPDPGSAAGRQLQLEPREQLELVADQGIRGDHTFGRMRHVTIVFEDDWKAAAAELGQEVAPARRAMDLFAGVSKDTLNLLVQLVAVGDDGDAGLGQVL